MKLQFNLCNCFDEGIDRLSDLLGFERGDGIKVSAEEGERVGVSLFNGEAIIYYRKKHQFFRELGLLCQNLRIGITALDITEDTHFETVSAMIDASRCAVPTVRSVKTLIEYFAIMGYGMMMLYTEDTIKVDSLPYFGYMRGAFTHDEIREIDDYAYSFGIELVPCIQCCGHMERYLIWPAAAKITDTVRELRARSPETLEFLDKWIGTVAGLFRSRKIHIGMDEAHDLGRGKFLDKNGYVPAFKLFNEYMSDLMPIVNKYGLTPMMWSDMYFRVHSSNKHAYYEKDTVIPEETKKLIPENMQMVYWHYGESADDETDYFMLEKHKELGRRIMIATGAWSWAGHFPEFNLMMKSNRTSLEACRASGVREAMLTIWGNDNAECDYFANMLSLSYFAELCYNPEITEEELKERFASSTGGDFDLFMALSYYHTDFENPREFSNPSQRFFGKSLFWQDPLMGLYDYELWKAPKSQHYAYAKSIFKDRAEGRWAYLYAYAYDVMAYLEKKCFIAENLVRIYEENDRSALSDMARVHLPELVEKCSQVYSSHKSAWRRNNKTFGWQNMDVKYSGLIARCKTAIEYIEDYLSGTLDKIDELEEKRLPHRYSAYTTQQKAFTVNWR